MVGSRLSPFSAGAGDGAAYRAADLRNSAAIREAVTAICPDAVIHLASISSPAHSSLEEIYATNLGGTRHLRAWAEALELGNIDVSRDWSDVRFVCDCYPRLVDCDAAVGGTFNICSGVATSLRYVIDLACVAAGASIEVRFNPAFARSNEIAGCGAITLGSRRRSDHSLRR